MNIKKYIGIILVMLMIVGMTGCSSINQGGDVKNMSTNINEQKQYTQVSMEEAIAIMETEQDYIILDVRTSEEYSEYHIPNAINIPNETIGTNEILELQNKEQLILVYCRSGNRSKQAAKKLADLGYSHVVEFGGINDWPKETVSE